MTMQLEAPLLEKPQDEDIIEEVVEEIVEDAEEEPKKMASPIHSYVNNRIAKLVTIFVDDNGLGYVFDSSAIYNFQDNLPKRQPDTSFVKLEKLSQFPKTELKVVPDLAVEVVSTYDTVFEVMAKVKQYQKAGVGLIWIVNTEVQTVEVYKLANGLRVQGYIGDDELSGEDVLPGFTLKVSSIFI